MLVDELKVEHCGNEVKMKLKRGVLPGFYRERIAWRQSADVISAGSCLP